MSQFDPGFVIGLGAAFLIVAAVVALPVAIAVTLVLIHQFRRRVERSMRAAAASVGPETRRSPSCGPMGELKLEWIAATRTRAVTARAQPLVAEARRRMRQLAVIYATSSAAYPLLLAALVVIASPPANWALLPFALLYATHVVEFAMPVALAPTVVVNRQPRYLALAVLVLVALVWVWSAAVLDTAIQILLMTAGVPTGAVLLLSMRRLRAVGPVVFAATLALVYGAIAGLAYATIYAVAMLGPWQFVRADLAGMPLLDATRAYFMGLASLPLDQLVTTVAQLASDPKSVLRAEHPEALTPGLWLRFFAIWLAATVAGAVVAGAIVRWLARSYQARRASDQMLTIDVIMLILGLSFFVILFAANWVYAAGALAGLAGYKLVTIWCLRRRRDAAPASEPHTLLLLRVFGFDRRTQQLLDDLGRRWRYLGPIQLIGGTDLAYATIEPHEFFEFLNGRLSRAFIKDEEDLATRLSANVSSPDPDGLFRVEDFFCHDDTWRVTVSGLARDATAVLMDLRGFSPAHRGCIYEIEELIATVPVQRIVLLVDGSTDVTYLERTLAGAWHGISGESPNLAPGQHHLRILRAATRGRHTLAALLGLLCEHPAGKAQSSRP